MDTPTLHALESIGYACGVLLFAIILGRAIIGGVLRFVWKHRVGYRRDKHYSSLAGYIGAIETVLYAMSVVLGKPEFIGVWLVLKAVGEWPRPKQENGQEIIGMSKEYAAFLIGNALSVIIGVATGLLILQIVPPLPASFHFQLPLSQ